MKKILSILMIIILLSTTIFIGKVHAQSVPLNSITLDANKSTVHPGETITLTINFVTDLGAYTFDIA